MKTVDTALANMLQRAKKSQQKKVARIKRKELHDYKSVIRELNALIKKSTDSVDIYFKMPTLQTTAIPYGTHFVDSNGIEAEEIIKKLRNCGFDVLEMDVDEQGLLKMKSPINLPANPDLRIYRISW